MDLEKLRLAFLKCYDELLNEAERQENYALYLQELLVQFRDLSSSARWRIDENGKIEALPGNAQYKEPK